MRSGSRARAACCELVAFPEVRAQVTEGDLVLEEERRQGVLDLAEARLVLHAVAGDAHGELDHVLGIFALRCSVAMTCAYAPSM